MTTYAEIDRKLNNLENQVGKGSDARWHQAEILSRVTLRQGQQGPTKGGLADYIRRKKWVNREGKPYAYGTAHKYVKVWRRYEDVNPKPYFEDAVMEYSGRTKESTQRTNTKAIVMNRTPAFLNEDPAVLREWIERVIPALDLAVREQILAAAEPVDEVPEKGKGRTSKRIFSREFIDRFDKVIMHYEVRTLAEYRLAKYVMAKCNTWAEWLSEACHWYEQGTKTGTK